MIPFYIDTRQPWVLPERAREAVLAAAATWEAANPVIDFDYRGAPPCPTPTMQCTAGVQDQASIIGWVNGLDPDDVARATTWDNPITEADVALNVMRPWNWHPCEQEDESCTPVPENSPVKRDYDIQAVLTHEIGHWLALDDLITASSAELTMHDPVPVEDRKPSTLGLGDILGVRDAYPCGCGRPKVYVP